AHRFLGGHRGVGDPLLRYKGALDELAQRGDEGLPTEPPKPAVGKAVGTAGDPVMITILGIGTSEDLGIGHCIEESEAKNVGGGSARSCRRLRGNGLALDAERGIQGWGDVLLDHRTAALRQRVAEAVGPEKGHMHLRFVSSAARHGVLVALGASGSVEERTQPRFGRELFLHDLPALLEQFALLFCQAGKGIPGLDGPGASQPCDQRRPEKGKHAQARHASHRPPPGSCTSTVCAKFSSSDFRNWTRTMIPGLRSERRRDWPFRASFVPEGTEILTMRRAWPHPVRRFIVLASGSHEQTVATRVSAAPSEETSEARPGVPPEKAREGSKRSNPKIGTSNGETFRDLMTTSVMGIRRIASLSRTPSA